MPAEDARLPRREKQRPFGAVEKKTTNYGVEYSRLRLLHVMEVGTLSGRGKAWTPVRSITDRHSLFPSSSTRSSNSFPDGLPAALHCSGRLGGESGLPRSLQYQHVQLRRA